MSCTRRLILTWLVNIQTFEQVRTVSVSWNIYLYNHRYFLFPLYWMLVHCLITPCGIWQMCTGWVAPTVRSSSACLTVHAARREQIRWSKVNRTASWQNSTKIMIIIIIISNNNNNNNNDDDDNYNKLIEIWKAVTKISSCWVYAISKVGNSTASEFLWSRFLLLPTKIAGGHAHSSRGKFPAPGPRWQPLI